MFLRPKENPCNDDRIFFLVTNKDNTVVVRYTINDVKDLQLYHVANLNVLL